MFVANNDYTYVDTSTAAILFVYAGDSIDWTVSPDRVITLTANGGDLDTGTIVTGTSGVLEILIGTRATIGGEK